MELSQETLKIIDDFAKKNAGELYDSKSEMVLDITESELWDNKVFNITEGARFMAAKYEAAQKEITRIGNELVETDLQRLAEKKRADELQEDRDNWVQMWKNAIQKVNEWSGFYHATVSKNSRLSAENERLREGLKNLRWGLFKGEDEVNNLIESLLKNQQ